MDTDLETLATAPYVTTDDLLRSHPEVLPRRPAVGIAPAITDAEILTLAVMGPLLGLNGERRWVRHARRHYQDSSPTSKVSRATTSDCEPSPEPCAGSPACWQPAAACSPTMCGW